MYAAMALVRANWLTAKSYKLNLLLSLAYLAASILPLYFVSDALQSEEFKELVGVLPESWQPGARDALAQLPTDLGDQEERRAHGPVRPRVCDGEADRRDGAAGVLGGGRRHRHGDGLEADAREAHGVHRLRHGRRVQPGGADLLEGTVGAPPLRQVGALEVHRARIAHQRGR